MARKNTPTEELYEVAVSLLVTLKGCRKFMVNGWFPRIDALIRRAEKATKARPK